jgi:hypothetical protein
MRFVLLLIPLSGALAGCVPDINGDMNGFLSQNGLATHI